ncbi:F0F1 ATP synthase subunit delta [uncultured Tolumonas sp.]|uniref:F0F1 ATP synthase subunit delta n=1 Tax=uncultured Tolumonas sp. TaxID=263765 RepID=UPI00292CEA5A|nr:F0F1 ATP synthase subunit delta [uncultured Tolumonas sp.]
MAFDWSTFVLEIINFLALVWILKRFLYQPVLTTLAERRAGVERTLREAQGKENSASALKTQYESRLADWEQEKTTARALFATEIAAERQRQMESLNKELLVERERNVAQETHRQEVLRQELAAECNLQARQFASKLLAKLASPELEARLIELFIEEIKVIPAEQSRLIQIGLDGHGNGVVTSAYPLSVAQRKQISTVIDDQLELHSQLEYIQDANLLAGLRISLGAWQLDLSLAGELSVYAEASGFGQ